MNQWTLRKSEPILDSPWMTVSRNAYDLPDGTSLADYFVVTRRDFVLIVALDSDGIVLVEQYRPATDRTYVCLPAGYIATTESPEAAALRELGEETGLRAGQVRVVAELHPLPGYLRSKAFVVICERLSGVLRTLDPGEIDSVRRVAWPEALEMIRNGEIIEMQAVSAILLAHHLLDGKPQLA